LSDKNVLQIVDQAADPDYSPQIETASFKKPRGRRDEETVHAPDVPIDRSRSGKLDQGGGMASAARGARATVHHLEYSETIEGGTDDFR
jgi:hypothetical protein